MRDYLKKIKRIDNFAYNVFLNFNEQKNTNTTVFGGVLSLIYYAFLLIYFGILI